MSLSTWCPQLDKALALSPRWLRGEQEGVVSYLAGHTPAYRASSNVWLFHNSMVLLTHIQFMIDD